VATPLQGHDHGPLPGDAISGLPSLPLSLRKRIRQSNGLHHPDTARLNMNTKATLRLLLK